MKTLKERHRIKNTTAILLTLLAVFFDAFVILMVLGGAGLFLLGASSALECASGSLGQCWDAAKLLAGGGGIMVIGIGFAPIAAMGVSIIATFTFAVIFSLLGAGPFKGKSMASLAAATFGEFIPLINFFPIWTGGVIISILLVRREDTQYNKRVREILRKKQEAQRKQLQAIQAQRQATQAQARAELQQAATNDNYRNRVAA